MMDTTPEQAISAAQNELTLTINREQLLKPLQLISGAIDRKQTLPILSNILFEIEDSTLTLTGTDLEVELIQRIAFDGASHNAACAIPAKKLHDICKALPNNAMLRFTRKNHQMILTSGKSRFLVNLLPANDFPTVEKSGNDQFSFTMASDSLSSILEKTQFAMALQDVRYFLNGLLLDIQGTRCTAVATDGHRLASSCAELDQSFAERHQVLIPRKAVHELIKLLNTNDAGQSVNIQVGENYISVTCDAFEFTSKLIDGRFPEYRTLIPKECTKHAIIAIDDFKDALSRVAILSNEKFRGAWVSFTDNKAILQANNPDNDEAEEEVNTEMHGDDIRIGCNVNYILDVLAVLKGDNIKILMTDANSSVLLLSPDHPDDQYVVMPMCL